MATFSLGLRRSGLQIISMMERVEYMNSIQISNQISNHNIHTWLIFVKINRGSAVAGYQRFRH